MLRESHQPIGGYDCQGFIEYKPGWSITSREESSARAIEQNCTGRPEVPAEVGPRRFPEHLLPARVSGKPKVTQSRKPKLKYLRIRQ
jgi:hypothetical protein